MMKYKFKNVLEFEILLNNLNSYLIFVFNIISITKNPFICQLLNNACK